jgi:hypothetical protein
MKKDIFARTKKKSEDNFTLFKQPNNPQKNQKNILTHYSLYSILSILFSHCKCTVV